MKILTDTKNFAIRGTGIIIVDNYGNIEVNGEELRDVIAKAFVFDNELYDNIVCSGTLTLNFELDMTDELAIVREDGTF